MIALELNAVGAHLIFTDERYSDRAGAFASERFREQFRFVTEMHEAGKDVDDTQTMKDFFAHPAGRMYTEEQFFKRRGIKPRPSLLRDTMKKYCGVHHRAGIRIGSVGGSTILLMIQYPSGAQKDFSHSARRLGQIHPILFRALQLRAEMKWVQLPIEDRLAWSRKFYNLTRSEYEILCKMLIGNTGPEIADAHGISYETYRSHAKSILFKTGCRSKIEVAVKLMNTDVSNIT